MSGMSMMHRGKEAGDSRRPEPPWLVGAMIGLAISTLAGGAIMFGATMALGQMTKRGK